MQFTRKITDCNGFVLFDPTHLRAVLAREPEEDENVLRLFQTTELGDQVLRAGAIVPIYPLTDGGYRICVRISECSLPADWPQEPALVITGAYPLRVVSRLVLADLAVMQQWWPEMAWEDVQVEPGFYSVVISAYDNEPPAYDVVLTRERELPALTASLDTHIDIVTLNRRKP